jgi:hypothetical protein
VGRRALGDLRKDHEALWPLDSSKDRGQASVPHDLGMAQPATKP